VSQSAEPRQPAGEGAGAPRPGGVVPAVDVDRKGLVDEATPATGTDDGGASATGSASANGLRDGRESSGGPEAPAGTATGTGTEAMAAEGGADSAATAADGATDLPVTAVDGAVARATTAAGGGADRAATTTGGGTTGSGTVAAQDSGKDPGDPGPGREPVRDVGDDGRPGQAMHGVVGAVRELVLVVAIALGLSLLIKTFFVQAFFIPSESMENTMLRGDRILVTKLTPGPFELRRGDIVVFKDPGGWLGAPEPVQEGALRAGARRVLTFVGLLPSDSGQHLIKRIVGLPGDRVACCDANGMLTVNGKPIKEPYLKPGAVPSDLKFDKVIDPGFLWVMGDNRQMSKDSRFNTTFEGQVPMENVVGRSFVIVWPFDRAEWLDRPGDVFADVPAP